MHAGMHCMPSHSPKKDIDNLTKSTCKNLKENQTKLPQSQIFTFKSK